MQRWILLMVVCGYRNTSYKSDYTFSCVFPNYIPILYSIAFRMSLLVSSIFGYDCILPSSVLPYTLGRNAINIKQYKNKITDEFPIACCTNGSKTDSKVGFAFVVFRDGCKHGSSEFSIRDECTIFIAELLCLNFAF